MIGIAVPPLTVIIPFIILCLVGFVVAIIEERKTPMRNRENQRRKIHEQAEDVALFEEAYYRIRREKGLPDRSALNKREIKWVLKTR